MTSNKKFIIDDWGMSQAINDSILDLISLNSVYGVSILIKSNYADWKIKALVKESGIKLGLHIELGLGEVFLSSKSDLEDEINNQVDDLLNLAGRVDYLDGHIHRHLYPRVIPILSKISKIRNLKIRVIKDPSHIGSYILGAISDFYLNNNQVFYCNYLVPKDLKDERFIIQKLQDSLPLVIHSTTDNSLLGFDKFRYEQYVVLKRVLKR